MQQAHPAQAKAFQSRPGQNQKQGNKKNAEKAQKRLWRKNQVSGYNQKTEQKTEFCGGMQYLQTKKTFCNPKKNEKIRD